MAEAPKRKKEEEAEVHDLTEEREERENVLVRGAKSFGRGVVKATRATTDALSKVEHKAVNTVKRHPVITGVLLAVGTTYAAREGYERYQEQQVAKREDLLDEIGKAHLAQHDALVDQISDKGIKSTVREAFREERDELIKELERGPWKAANKAAKEVADRYEQRLKEEAA